VNPRIMWCVGTEPVSDRWISKIFCAFESDLGSNYTEVIPSVK